jgi:hypothetical protein
VWRLVLSGKATLQEIETHWSLDDLIRANLALTYHEHIQQMQAEESARAAGRR